MLGLRHNINSLEAPWKELTPKIHLSIHKIKKIPSPFSTTKTLKMAGQAHELLLSFSSQPRGWSEMGHKLGQSNCGDTGGGAHRDQSKPDSCLGVVRRQLEKGIENDLSANKEECEGRWASSIRSNLERGKEPMVDILGGHARTGEGGEVSVGTFATSITKPGSVHSEPTRMLDRTQYVRRDPNLHNCYGEQANQEVNPSFLPNSCLQSPCVSSRNGDGSPTTQPNVVARGRANKGDATMDKMEFEEGGQMDATF